MLWLCLSSSSPSRLNFHPCLHNLRPQPCLSHRLCRPRYKPTSSISQLAPWRVTVMRTGIVVLPNLETFWGQGFTSVCHESRMNRTHLSAAGHSRKVETWRGERSCFSHTNIAGGSQGARSISANANSLRIWLQASEAEHDVPNKVESGYEFSSSYLFKICY